ncbi:2-C-methyl-D-erythritol 4-phosphate cytidylyltransferase [Bacillus alkalicellulosilyticus]|uniref:2-C-methyl-D-erythritol 4-phosphate cytidylyltransferase n=1 Tax=Alkalihalobacterium alkalicellulosilyticum TaxID=1912214 RepID=UPI000996B182|nr:2-C-methyl-D-erythritol 4-phosphate cytidylyltransferase [Bacillus alkalicellulosilyticus]
MEYSVVIPAAGQGKRMGAGKNKQFIEIANIPVIIHTISVFQQDSNCSSIIVVANQEELAFMTQLIKEYNLTKVTRVIPGGSERQFSVEQGIVTLQKEGIVLIHDGARPFISHEHIQAVAEKAAAVGAAVVGVPVKDTVKRVNQQSLIEETVERSSLWAIQTPQAFRLSVIKDAHAKAKVEGFLGTDDASLVERYGQAVAIVKGDYLNMKLTTPEDLLFAEAILSKK